MFLQRGVLQPRKEAAVNFGCPPVYHNERCDTLCQEAMTLPELEEDVGYMNTDSVPEQSNTV